jgi:cytochrome P450
LHSSPLSCVLPVPGPKLAAATGLVFFYKLLRGEEVFWETETHRHYGEVVRLGPDRLSYINPQAWKDIAGAGAGKRRENNKDPSTFGPDIHSARSLGSQPEVMVHRSQRRVFAPAFSDKALKLQEPLILGYINSLVRIIRNHATDSPTDGFDLVKLLNCTTFDVMADLAFGEPLGLLEQSVLTPWVQAVFNNVQRMSVSRVAREYKILSWFIKAATPKKITQGAQLHYNHSYERAEKRLDRGIDIGKPDIWKLAMEKTEDVSAVSKRQITAHAQAFMMAGTETTATLLSGLTFLLLKHPHYMRRLQAEVRALEIYQLNLENLAHLPFMNACLQEALRVYPPAPIAFFRITPKEGNMICGEWIPEGVSTSPLSHKFGKIAYSNHDTRPASPFLTTPSTITPSTSKTPTLLSPSAGSLAPTTTATVKMH